MTPKLKRPTDWRNRFGGILASMVPVPKDESLFEGGCFVFDSRGVVGAD
jgi:predicted sulfurtransferase